MKVKLFVAYLRRDLAHSSPLALLGLPYFLFTYCRNCYNIGASTESDAPSCLAVIREAYPNWYDDSNKDLFVDLDAIAPAKGDRTGSFNDEGGEQGSTGQQYTKWEQSLDAGDGKAKPVNRAVLPAKTLRWMARVNRLYRAAYPDTEEDTTQDVMVCGDTVMHQVEMHIKNKIKLGTNQDEELEAMLEGQQQIREGQKEIITLLQKQQASSNTTDVMKAFTPSPQPQDNT